MNNFAGSLLYRPGPAYWPGSTSSTKTARFKAEQVIFYAAPD
jgi:hypothetical protein